MSESTWNLIPSSSDAAFSAMIAKKKGSTGSLSNIKIGKSVASTTNDFGGDLGELLIFTRELNSTEEQKVEGYLAHRWGATDSLDANHPYKTVAPVFDNKPLIGRVSNYSPKDIIGMKLSMRANYRLQAPPGPISPVQETMLPRMVHPPLSLMLKMDCR